MKSDANSGLLPQAGQRDGGIPRVSSGWLDRIQSVNYAILLLLCFVGFQLSAMYRAAQGFEEAAGNPFRQITTTVLFVAICAIYALRPRKQILRLLPLSMWIFFAWLMLSILWSDAPEISVRRAGFAIMLTLALFICVRQIGIERAHRIMIIVICAIIAADLLAVALWPFAVHQAGEYSSALAGSWRGIHSHKNNAGALAGTAVILLFGAAVYRRSLRHAIWAALASVMLLGSYSKTSIGFVLAAIVIGVIAEKATPHSLMRRAGTIAAISVVIGGFLVVALTDESAWVEALDPEDFTGRMEIWYLLAQYISEHFWLGSGYGAFWKIGYESPVAVMTESWVAGTGSGHNGYLDLLAETGIFGLLLGVQAFGISIIAAFLRNTGLSREYCYVGIALLAYFMLRNLLESGFLVDHQMPIWVLAAAICTDISRSSDNRKPAGGS